MHSRDPTWRPILTKLPINTSKFTQKPSELIMKRKHIKYTYSDTFWSVNTFNFGDNGPLSHTYEYHLAPIGTIWRPIFNSADRIPIPKSPRTNVCALIYNSGDQSVRIKSCFCPISTRQCKCSSLKTSSLAKIAEILGRVFAFYLTDLNKKV